MGLGTGFSHWASYPSEAAGLGQGATCLGVQQRHLKARGCGIEAETLAAWLVS